jgi:hypothetical protein
MFPKNTNKRQIGACLYLTSGVNFYFSPTLPFCQAAYIMRNFLTNCGRMTAG